MSVETYLRVPIFSSIEWGEDFDIALMRAARKAKVHYDHGEEEGKWEKFAFPGASAKAVKKNAEQVVPTHDPKAKIKIAGKHEVTVIPYFGTAPRQD